ncbi:MAG: glyoxalase [Kordiimonas sp.]|nr:glyoxalase [Kordiimonas sp.]
MSGLLSAGYVGVGASDLEAWERFTVDFMGMMVGTKNAGQLLTLRMDNHEQRLIIEKDDIDDMLFLGWELPDQKALEAYVEGLQRKGVEVTEASDELKDRRKVNYLYVAQDPNGFDHEFYAMPLLAPSTRPFRSAVLQGNFVAGDKGFGHATAMAQDYDVTRDFYENKLGLYVSDVIREEFKPGIVLDATFYHSETGRHHSLATGSLVGAPMPPGAKRIDHLMAEVDNLDDVGLAYDRAKELGFRVAKGLGRHPNDNMFSFYMVTPSGFQYEFGTGGLVIERPDWSAIEYSQMSTWGHKMEMPQGGNS